MEMIEIANKLADAVPLIEKKNGFVAGGEILTGVDLASGTQGARVVLSDQTVALDWIAVNARTVRMADAIIQARIDAENLEVDRLDQEERARKIETAK